MHQPCLLQKTIPFFLIFFIFIFSFAKVNVDSLEKLLPAVSGEKKLEVLDKLIQNYRRTDPNKCKEYFIQFEKLFLQFGEPSDYKAPFYHNKGEALMRDGNYPDAVTYLQKAIKISSAEKKYDRLWMSYNSVGSAYQEQGNITQALNYFLRAYKAADEHLEEGEAAGSAINLGVMYCEQGQFEEGLKYFQLSKEYHQKSGAGWGLGNCLNNIGQAHMLLGNNDSASYYFEKAMDVWQKVSDDYGIAMTNFNMGTLNFNLKKFDKAELQFLKSYEISEKINDQYAITQNLSALGSLYFELGKEAKGMEYLKKSIEFSEKNNILASVRDNYKTAYQFYKKKGDYQKALNSHEDFFFWYDSLNNAEKNKNLQKLQSQFETEKKEKEIEKQKAEIITKDLEISKSFTRMLMLSGGLVIVFVVAIFIFINLRQKQKANKEISQQKHEIEIQKKIVEEKNKDITDSINYSKRIQEAMLPAKEIKHKIFPDAFVLFQPRDLVSGDFYWFTEKNDRRLIAAVDCTGHGVPGSLMSMIGITFLNEIVNEKEITQPDIILSELRHRVIKSLKQTGSEGEANDGMDMALISFDDNNNIVEFAGANNPLWLFRNNKCIEYKPDKRTIGFFRGQGLPFTNHKIELQKGDTFYLFSDGYADQFGGPKGKKFKYRQLLEILLSIHQEPMIWQEEILLKTFNEWKGTLEQIDDVLVIGVKV